MDISQIDCEAQAPIFINGTKRCGSTLLRRIVNAHSQVTIPSPEWIFHFVYLHQYSYGDLNQDGNMLALIRDCLDIPLIEKFWGIESSPEQIMGLLPERSFRGLYVTLFLLYMGERPTPRWGAKTPSNVFWTRELHAMYPQAKFVFLYRDGRDVSIDQVNTHWGPMNLFNACHLWDHYTKAMLQAKKILPKDCYHELYYEKMVNDPQDEIAALCAFLDLEYEPSMLNFFANGDDPFFSQSHHLKADNPITNDYVGLYKSLPLEDRQLQVALIGETLKELGYDLDVEPREIGFWEAEWYVEEDEYGATLTEGGPQYKLSKRAGRQERKEQGVWSDADRIRHFLGRSHR